MQSALTYKASTVWADLHIIMPGLSISNLHKYHSRESINHACLDVANDAMMDVRVRALPYLSVLHVSFVLMAQDVVVPFDRSVTDHKL